MAGFVRGNLGHESARQLYRRSSPVELEAFTFMGLLRRRASPRKVVSERRESARRALPVEADTVLEVKY